MNSKHKQKLITRYKKQLKIAMKSGLIADYNNLKLEGDHITVDIRIRSLSPITKMNFKGIVIDN